MSFWAPIVQTLMGGLGSWLGDKVEQKIPGLSGAGNMGGQIGGMLGAGMMGSPMPGSGAEAGQFAKEYYDKIAPNSGPWDRLGAQNPGGQLAAESRKADLAERMQKRDLKNKVEVAQIQRKTALETKGMEYGLEGVSAAGNLGRGIAPDHRFNWQRAVSLAKLVPELNNLKADEQAKITQAALNVAKAQLTGHEATIKGAVAEYADLIAIQQGFGGAVSSLAASGAGRLLDLLSPGLSNVVKHFMPPKLRKIMYPKQKKKRTTRRKETYKDENHTYEYTRETRD